jgi:hypothetical protein
MPYSSGSQYNSACTVKKGTGKIFNHFLQCSGVHSTYMRSVQVYITLRILFSSLAFLMSLQWKGRALWAKFISWPV